jgi:protein KTI12
MLIFSMNLLIVANEETLLLNKKTAFQDATKEKMTRGVLKSYVDQKLNSKSVVILDSLNYIKGFRYELHCMARELRSSHCVVWVQGNERLAEAWNVNRAEDDRYDEPL